VSRETDLPRRHRLGDVERLRAALSRVHSEVAATSVMHPGDLAWALHPPRPVDPLESLLIWDDHDTIEAFAFVEPGELDLQLLVPDPSRRLAVIDSALAVAEATARAGSISWLRTRWADGDQQGIAALQDAGFALDEGRTTSRGEPYRGSVRFALDLAPGPDHGSTRVRSVGPAEWPARVDLHGAVWSTHQTVESYARLRQAPGYDADLDLVAVDDGVLTAYAIVWYDAPSRVGVFEPVGTHPEHRRRGAAAAVMREGLQRLRRRGARRALVTSSVDNPASLGLYRSVGFVEVGRSRCWRRDLTSRGLR
jgi:mycothiol synthase